MNTTPPPYSTIYGDVYFSAEDGLAETRHVFLGGNNLPACWSGKAFFRIGETGFGTGLNFLAAARLFSETAQPGQKLHFLSVELSPLPPEEIRTALSPWIPQLTPFLDKVLKAYEITGDLDFEVTPGIRLTCLRGDANDILPSLPVPEGGVNAWFFDGFTPARNPGLWTQRVFDHAARLSAPGATMASFTAAGQVRRGLSKAGFLVEKRPGFGRKRDMIAGIYLPSK